jgi:ectoine hydroxylase-related dioxygenase (phytanoyl-CoA dioxygenase family)
VNAAPFEPAFTEWQERSDAAEFVADLLDSRYVRAWVDAIFIKERTRGAASDEGLSANMPPNVELNTWDNDPAITPWHSDVCNWPFWGEKMAIVWVALTDVGPDNAPLVTIDGSHVGSVRYHSRFETQSVVLPQYRPWSQLLERVNSPESRRRVWCMQAGDCIVMHCATLHASLPQTQGARRRMSYSCRWLGDDVIYQPNALTRTLDPAASGSIPMRPREPPPDRYFPRTWTRASPHSSSTRPAGPCTPDEIRS